MPRGGSTFISELLSTMQRSIVFFEPLWHMQHTDCSADENCISQYLTDILTCKFQPDFEQWLKEKTLFFNYFNSNARKCLSKAGKDRVSCITDMNLVDICQASPIRITKVIRARLSWLENMLSDALLNLKVIHLTRDPRGSIRSISTFGWPSDQHDKCSELEQDLDAYEILSQKFPTKVLQLRYEDFCVSPVSSTREIFKFLLRIDNIPDTVQAYLDSHSTGKMEKKGSMSTFKNSKQQYDAWRYKISPELLDKIEKEPACLRSIKRMQYRVFNSLDNAKNGSVSLFNS